jgi:hypothetical protein
MMLIVLLLYNLLFRMLTFPRFLCDPDGYVHVEGENPTVLENHIPLSYPAEFTVCVSLKTSG